MDYKGRGVWEDEGGGRVKGLGGKWAERGDRGEGREEWEGQGERVTGEGGEERVGG